LVHPFPQPFEQADSQLLLQAQRVAPAQNEQAAKPPLQLPAHHIEQGYVTHAFLEHVFNIQLPNKKRPAIMAGLVLDYIALAVSIILFL